LRQCSDQGCFEAPPYLMARCSPLDMVELAIRWHFQGRHVAEIAAALVRGRRDTASANQIVGI
jgi:hypothetical protein